MTEWTIYGSNGAEKAVVKELELHDEWMAECFITVTVKSAEPIAFAVGDYIDYRNERYTIQYDPNVIKKSSRGTYGEGFTYENIKFVGLQDEVVRCDFNDIVLGNAQNNLHYTALPTFPFYCESVDDLLDRIQANLEDLYPGMWTVIGLNTIRNKDRGTSVDRVSDFIDAYKQWIDPNYNPLGEEKTDPYGKQAVAETVDNITCWDALKKVHDDFELNFIVRGRTIIVGTAGVFTANTFRYGKGNGLTEIERVAESDQRIITRLRAYGSETNLPDSYYANLNLQVFATITSVSKYGTNGASFLLDLDFDTKYFTNRSVSYPGTSESPNYIITISANGNTVRAYVTKDYSSNKCYVYCEYTGGPDDRDEPDQQAMADFVNDLAVDDVVYFVDYVKKESFGSDHKDYATQYLPNNMAVMRLMLPGFPSMSLHDWVQAHKDDADKEWLAQAVEEGFTFSEEETRPYIDSPNKNIYGIRPASIYFDGSNDTDDIHPTIEGMVYNEHPVDEIYAADKVEDNGKYPAGEEVKNINITLPVLGFELDKVWTDEASIDMKNGMCGARSFKIANKPKKDDIGRWVCNVSRVHDDSLDLWFPYCDFQIHGSSEENVEHGDKYILTGIDMPSAYVDFAAIRLLRASIEALRKNHAPRYTFQPRIDSLWMQRQHDTSLSVNDVVSLHDTLKAGDIFAFADTDLNINANIVIDVLSIKENGNNGIPTYEVTLRDEKQISTIQKITSKIDSVFSGGVNGNGGGNDYSTRQILSLIDQIATEKFLSKQTDDSAAGNIGFKKNISIDGMLQSNNIQSSEYTGDGMLDVGYKIWFENGRAKMVIDDLVARGKFSVNELESRIWTYAGGNMVFSGAGSTIFYVEYLDANGNTLGYTNIFSPWLLRGKALLAGQVAWSKRKQIMRKLTDAEKLQVAKFRCYEYSDNGTMQTRNWWHINDLAFCESLNHVKDKTNSDGSYSGAAENTVYWRKVVGIGSKMIPAMNDGRVYDYVDLSLSDHAQGYDDWPAAGDVIVQRGNVSDVSRQSMVSIEITGDVFHGIKIYDSISGYNMGNTEWISLGYDVQTGKAKANIYGDCYIGARPAAGQDVGSTYMRFLRDADGQGNGLLEIKARINAQSTIGNQSLPDYIKANQKTYDAAIASLVLETEDLQRQIDGAIETYFLTGVPSLTTPPVMKPQGSTYPDTPWLDGTETSEERTAILNNHVGDLYYDKTTGHGYRFMYDDDNSVFVWTLLTDEDVTEALRMAAEAQETADGKMTIYSTWGAWIKDNVNTLQEGDLYIPTSDYPAPPATATYKARHIYKCTTDGSATFTEPDYTNNDVVNAIISRYGNIMNIQNPTADNVGEALGHLREVLKGDTQTDGGLILTHAIYMKGTETTPIIHAGISGVYEEQATGTGFKGHGTAAWFGGGVVNGVPIDHEVDTDPTLDFAKTLFRFDGTGYLASGNIKWNADGSGSVAGGNIEWNAQGAITKVEGQQVKATTIYLGNDNITDKLNALFDMFTLEGAGTTVSPHVIKANYSLYSDGDISALGAAAGGGGGGGGASVLYELNDVLANQAGTSVLDAQAGYVLTCVANGAGLAWKAAPVATTLAGLTDTSISSPENGQALIYNSTSGKWENGTISGGVQSDWNETDTNSLAYIQNKPTIPTASNTNTGYAANADYALSAGGVAWGNVSGKPSFAAVATSGNYNDLSNKPTIPTVPTNVSAFTNDSGYITSSGSCSYATTAGTATYANSAGSASSAGYATSAGSATSADYASDLKAGSAAEIWVGNVKRAYFDSNGSLILLNSDDSDGTSWNHPALCIGGEASASHVEIDSNEVMAKSNASTTSTLYLNAEGGDVVINESSGNCGIGVTSPSYKLHVSGDIYATGDVTAASDERQKCDIEQVDLNVEQIANAPAIKFSWKDGRDNLRHVGSFAQYWQKVLPESVTDKNDILGLNYGSAALVSVKKVAERVLSDEEEIEQLRKRISELEHEVEQLKSA